MSNWGTTARTVRIDDGLWEDAKENAANDEVSVSDIIRTALIRYNRGQFTMTTKTAHKIETVERGTSGDQGQYKGYAARCTCGAITFGGFGTRTEARAALEHEEGGRV